MKDQYRRIFEIQYDHFALQPWESNFPSHLLVQLIKDQIERSATEIGVGARLRSDAKFFLLVNLCEMIAKPVLANQMFSPEVAIQSVFSTLQQDLITILLAAKKEGVANQEITGGDIARSLGPVYDKLGVTHFEVWG